MNNIAQESPLVSSLKPFGWMLLGITSSTYAACVAGYAVWHFDITLEKVRKLTQNRHAINDEPSIPI